MLAFALGEAGNAWAHVKLCRLRSGAGLAERALPSGGLFQLIDCPHYLFEIVSWIGFALVAAVLQSWVFALAVTGILVTYARAHATGATRPSSTVARGVPRILRVAVHSSPDFSSSCGLWASTHAGGLGRTQAGVFRARFFRGMRADCAALARRGFWHDPRSSTHDLHALPLDPSPVRSRCLLGSCAGACVRTEWSAAASTANRSAGPAAPRAIEARSLPADPRRPERRDAGRPHDPNRLQSALTRTSGSRPPSAWPPHRAGGSRAWHWVGTHGLTFVPSAGRLPRSTAFRVEVPASITSATGEALGVGKTFSFVTPRPALAGQSERLLRPRWPARSGASVVFGSRRPQGARAVRSSGTGPAAVPVSVVADPDAKEGLLVPPRSAWPKATVLTGRGGSSRLGHGTEGPAKRLSTPNRPKCTPTVRLSSASSVIATRWVAVAPAVGWFALQLDTAVNARKRPVTFAVAPKASISVDTDWWEGATTTYLSLSTKVVPGQAFSVELTAPIRDV